MGPVTGPMQKGETTMKGTFTTQDVIDMGVELYDDKGFTRENIRIFLQCLLDNGKADFDLERVFDLIVG